VLQLIPALSWLIFLIYWIASARGTKTTIERQRRSREVVMRLPLLAGGYLIGSGGRAIGLATPIVRAGIPALQIAGCVFCTLGLAFTLWARRTLATNWSSSVTFKENHELIQGGPYAYVRNPIYTGMLGMLIADHLFVFMTKDFLLDRQHRRVSRYKSPAVAPVAHVERQLLQNYLRPPLVDGNRKIALQFRGNHCFAG
jgi:protein-S-isoprenylcysteine O-methyltransferase Ste14